MIQAINLKIAYMKNPIGIDEKNPVLTWKCRDAIKQSAYEIEYKDYQSKYGYHGVSI